MKLKILYVVLFLLGVVAMYFFVEGQFNADKINWEHSNRVASTMKPLNTVHPASVTFYFPDYRKYAVLKENANCFCQERSTGYLKHQSCPGDNTGTYYCKE